MGNYLVTGGSGFFGSILCQALADRGDTVVTIDLQPCPYRHARVRAVQNDIRHKEVLEALFRAENFDAVFHCAAMLAHDVKSPQELWSSNVDGTQNVFACCQTYAVPKIVFISSNCLWGKSFSYPVSEEEPPAPVEIYGRSKLAGEKILLSDPDRVHSIIFRSPTIMDEGRLGLLGILFEFIDEGRKLWQVGDGTNRYQFIYAKDLATACIAALDYPKCAVFNIGSDNVKTFNEVYTAVLRQSGSTSKLAYFPKWLAIPAMKIAYALGLSPLGPYQYKMIASSFVFDTTAIKRELSWRPTLTNEAMLLRAYTYYHDHKQEIAHRTNMSAHNVVARMGIIRLLKWLS